MGFGRFGGNLGLDCRAELPSNSTWSSRSPEQVETSPLIKAAPGGDCDKVPTSASAWRAPVAAARDRCGSDEDARTVVEDRCFYEPLSTYRIKITSSQLKSQPEEQGASGNQETLFDFL